MSPTRQFTEGLVAGIALAADALADRLDHQSRELLAELARNIESIATRAKLSDAWREDIEPRLDALQRIFPPPPAPAPRPAAAAPEPQRPTQPPAPAPRRRPAPALFPGSPRNKRPFPTR